MGVGVGVYVGVYVLCIYTYLGVVLNVSYPGAGRKKPCTVFPFFFFLNRRACGLPTPLAPFYFKISVICAWKNLLSL